MNDIASIFKAYDIRGKVGEQLTPALAKRIGQVYGQWLPRAGTVAVGRDMRPDSAELAQAFIDGLTSVGRSVWDIGLVTSDMIYFAVGKWDLAGGAVITASHNPGKDNGIKLYRDQVTAVGLDSGLSDIRDRVLSNEEITTADSTGAVKQRSITEQWIDHSLGFITELKPFKIAVDAGNGMAGAILPSLLPHLPLEVEQMYFDLDGSFPNHEANPQNYANLEDLSRKIVADHLDFGLAFDGDGDRAALVDDLGRPVAGTDLLTLLAGYYLNKYPGSKIVHDVRTSRATIELINEWGGQPVRTKAGRVNIGAKMREVGASLGGETTGHVFFTENYEADSGLITALVAMQAISDNNQKLSNIIDSYRRYAIIPESNFSVSQPKEVVFARLKEAYADYSKDELDGLTISANDFWFNLRASNTEPVMRLNAEATNEDELKKLTQNIKQLLGK